MSNITTYTKYALFDQDPPDEINLLVIRHGNTFDAGDTLRRVGAGSDLPLSTSGQQQAQRLGLHLQNLDLLPDHVFCSPLQRTQQTAKLALAATGHQASIQPLVWLTEIDYGPDEGQPETQVIARLGQTALDLWETQSLLPAGWQLDLAAIRAQWHACLQALSLTCRTAPSPKTQQSIIPNSSTDPLSRRSKTVWMVTSNGIARFILEALPQLQPQQLAAAAKHSKKLRTGAYGHFHFQPHSGWRSLGWNRQAIAN